MRSSRWSLGEAFRGGVFFCARNVESAVGGRSKIWGNPRALFSFTREHGETIETIVFRVLMFAAFKFVSGWFSCFGRCFEYTFARVREFSLQKNLRWIKPLLLSIWREFDLSSSRSFIVPLFSVAHLFLLSLSVWRKLRPTTPPPTTATTAWCVANSCRACSWRWNPEQQKNGDGVDVHLWHRKHHREGCHGGDWIREQESARVIRRRINHFAWRSWQVQKRRTVEIDDFLEHQEIKRDSVLSREETYQQLAVQRSTIKDERENEKG